MIRDEKRSEGFEVKAKRKSEDLIEFLPCDFESEWIELDKDGNEIGRHKEKGFGTFIGYIAKYKSD
ncbi:MAG: hypothetical protein PHP08_00665 [Candidatus Dojkabacteria bacterium]|nr:hypothetical protein [Candidatus Dojkabacteria bacterium]